MAVQWWFQVLHDQTLRFRSPDSGEAVRVVSVLAETDEMVRVTVENETVMILNINHYVGVDMTFNVLELSADSNHFCITLNAIMRGREFGYFVPGQPLNSSPTVKKYEYKCPYQFAEQIEIMRHLHPHCQTAGDSELLDPKNREWRTAAQRAMQYKGTAGCWGGHFKEAIVISTISRRCYHLIRSIIATRKTLFLKVTGFMFRGFCGCKDEGFMYTMLRKWDQGDISPNDVNEQLKQEKALTRPVTECDTLRTKNAELERQVADLMEEVKDLKAKLDEALEMNARPAQTYNDDMYDFSPNHETSQEETKLKRPKYTVCYKPESGSELDDSHHDPDWMDNEVEKASDTSESEISLNQAFMSITEWNPLEIKIECTEKFQNVLSGEEISDELRKVEDTHLQEDTTDKTDVCDAATIIDDDVQKAQNTVLLQDTREKNHIPDSLDEKKGIATRIFKTCEGLRQKMKRKKADCSPEAAKLPQKRSRRVSEIFKVGDKVMALWVDKNPELTKYHDARIVNVISSDLFKVRYTEDDAERFLNKKDIQRI